MSLITRTLDQLTTVSTVTSAPHMTAQDWCPHCKASTHWHLSLWRKHTRCLDCGENPLQPPTQTEAALATASDVETASAEGMAVAG
jgi:hypothetical protein